MLHLFRRFTLAVLNLVDPYSDSEEPPADTVWPYLKANLRPLRTVMLLSLLFTVCAASIEVWIVNYAGRLIDTLGDTAPQDIWAEHGNELLLAAIAVLLLRPAAQCARHAFNDIGIDCNVANLFRWRAHQHLCKQSVGWFQNDLTGRTTSRLVDVGNNAAGAIFNLLNAVAFGLVYMIGIILMMAQTDLRLTLPLLLWAACYIGMMVFIIPRMITAQQAFFNAKSALVGNVVDSFSNFDTLKLFSRKEAIAADHKVRLEDTRIRLFGARQIAVGMRTLVVLLEGVMMVSFVGYGLWLWSIGAGSIGLIGSAVALCLRITSLADWVLDAVWSIFLNVGSIREALKTIAQPISIPANPKAKALQLTGGEISFDAVRHQHGMGKGGLDELSVTFKAGEKVGLVGQSGAGKSTLVNLILRFYEAEQGRITVDGQDICHLSEDSLRSAIGMVSQQAALLNRSVYDNIAMGRENASEAEIFAAAKKAKAHDFIKKLTDNRGRLGYQAHVGERGVKLSGGQRQRIALARVFLKNAPILILDEATSALDSEVEAEIQAALEQVMQGKTVIAIAHRLSTIAQMDRIIVMQDGRIVEQGTHRELLNENGRYADFWARQSGSIAPTTQQHSAE